MFEIDAPVLKDGTGKELRCLHDVVLQHFQALKSLGHEVPGSFVTSLLELKLDATMMFEATTQPGARRCATLQVS